MYENESRSRLNNGDVILIVDFGSQYTHLISQRIRSLGVYTEIISPDDINLAPDILKNACGVILSGGPKSVLDEAYPSIELSLIIKHELPILGICYGHQLVAKYFGGVVKRGVKREYGPVIIERRESRLFTGVPVKFKVWMSHGDVVENVPEGFNAVAFTEYGNIAAMEKIDYPITTLQFHPEVKHTEYGTKILDNFIRFYTKCRRSWSPVNILDLLREELKFLKNNKVIVGVSGGVDSTVTSVILRRIVGDDNVIPVFIDTGLLRDGEREWVEKLYKDILKFKSFFIYDASKIFLENLAYVKDPEKKRRIFSETYIKVFEEVADRLKKLHGDIKYLAQGTLYPDCVESGVVSKYVDRIKSHHNVVIYGKHRFEIIEPLKDLYKNEVRVLARKLNLPSEVYLRHPFPGPGLAIRIVGRVTKRKLEILRKADKIVYEEVKKANVYDKVWQAFPVLLSVKSVGIKGDVRSYEYIIVIRIVESEDAMTANFHKASWELLERISKRILNEVEGVNRVLYDISNKPPATIEFE